MINIFFFSLKKNSARRDKTTIKVVYRLTDEVPYLCVVSCPILYECKPVRRQLNK